MASAQHIDLSACKDCSLKMTPFYQSTLTLHHITSNLNVTQGPMVVQWDRHSVVYFIFIIIILFV